MQGMAPGLGLPVARADKAFAFAQVVYVAGADGAVDISIVIHVIRFTGHPDRTHIGHRTADPGACLGFQEIRYGNHRQNGNDRHHDQQFDQCETFFYKMLISAGRLSYRVPIPKNPSPLPR